MKKIIYIAILTLFTVGCEKTIEFKGNVKQPMLVLNSFVSPDSTIKVKVTESMFFLDKFNGFKHIDDAELRLIVNGTDKGILTKSDSPGMYFSGYKLNPTDEVKIEAHVSGYLSVSARTTLPPKPIILQVDTSSTREKGYAVYTTSYNGRDFDSDTIAEYTNVSIRFSIKFKDKANERNYYRLVVKRRIYIDPDNSGGLIPEKGYFETFLSHFNDRVFDNKEQTGDLQDAFGENGSEDYYFDTFSDVLLNGKEYDLKFSDFYQLDYIQYGENGNIHIPNPEKIVYYVYFQEISEDYYLYIRSMISAQGKSGNPFVEPVQVYSNVQNGIGILGGFTSSDAYVVEINFK